VSAIGDHGPPKGGHDVRRGNDMPGQAPGRRHYQAFPRLFDKHFVAGIISITLRILDLYRVLRSIVYSTGYEV
jgi:hypothetical protein